MENIKLTDKKPDNFICQKCKTDKKCSKYCEKMITQITPIKNFVAIDFETANYERHSICQVGLVVVENYIIVDEYSTFVFPPGGKIMPKFTEIHGISNNDIRNADIFPDIFEEINKRISNKTIVAHNIAFDKNVMLKTMQYYEMEKEISNMNWDWKCTLKLFRSLNFHEKNGLRPLSEHYKIELNHHDAVSDARACAKLFMIHTELTNL